MPSPRTRWTIGTQGMREWFAFHQALAHEAAAYAPRKPALVFVGDSITETWRGTSVGRPIARASGAPDVLREKFGDRWDPLALAISGDHIVLAGKVKVLDGTGAEFKVLRWSDVNNVVAITALLDDEIQASLAPLTEKLTAEACDHCSLAYIPRDAVRKGVLPVWPQGDTVLLEMLAEQAGVSGVPRSQTVWVGGVPEALCAPEWLEGQFKRFGGIATVSCRAKAMRGGRHRSWALVSFWTELAALAAAREDGGRLALPDLGGIVLDVKIDENPTKSRALAILQTQRKASHRRRSSAVVGREKRKFSGERFVSAVAARFSPEHAEDPSRRRSSLLAKGRDTTPLGGPPSTPRRFFPWRASLAPADTPPVEATFSVTSNGGA